MEIINNTSFVFQTDSEIVQKVYKEHANYLIEYDEQCQNKSFCAIYFCSNDIYYPNTEDAFRKRIIENNFFEWYRCRIHRAYKHVFLRDVFKQWYLRGINAEINTPDKLFEFLQRETGGYRIITIGSSAGGYASILYGSLLDAVQVMSFNAQFELNTLLSSSSEGRNPILFREKKQEVRSYYDIVDMVNRKTSIFYIFSNTSKWDAEQSEHAKKCTSIYRIPFNSSHHGIPFLKVALPAVINLSILDLKKYENKMQQPIWFTIKMVGVLNTLKGMIKQIYQSFKKILLGF